MNEHTIHTRFARIPPCDGMALIIALVLLLALTLLALAAGQVAVQQQRMVANTQAAQRAFQHAEEILREIESRLEDDGNADSFAAAEPIQSILEAGTGTGDCSDTWSFNWSTTLTRDDTESCQGEPCFQLLRFFHQDGNEVRAWSCMAAVDPGEENYYLVTARGQGGRAHKTVQSVYRTQHLTAASPGHSVTARLQDGRMVTISGNGLEDPPVQARLTLTGTTSGEIISERVLAESTEQPQGLFAPGVWLHAGTDAAGAGNAWLDRVYAGDVQGNLWRVDVGAAGELHPVFSEVPLFTTAPDQPIAARPAVAVHPDGGVMVYFGTGKCQHPDDALDDAAQAFYAVRDTNQPVTGGVGDGGWSVPLTAYKERVPLGARVVAGRVMFTSFEPATDSCYDGARRLYALDAVTGTPPPDLSGPVPLGQGAPLPPQFELFRPQDQWDAQLRLWHSTGGQPVVAGRVREGRQVWRQIE